MLNCFSCVQLFVTPWTVARQAPLSMGFSKQEYWSGLPCLSPWALPNLHLLHWQVGSLPLAPIGKAIFTLTPVNSKEGRRVRGKPLR